MSEKVKAISPKKKRTSRAIKTNNFFTIFNKSITEVLELHGKVTVKAKTGKNVHLEEFMPFMILEVIITYKVQYANKYEIANM